MIYNRILPRDAFNEANYLNCIGQLELLDISKEYSSFDGAPFDFGMSEDGDLYLLNYYWKTEKNDELYFYRGLNSREKFPLFIIFNGEYISVFEIDGTLSKEFLKILKQ